MNSSTKRSSASNQTSRQGPGARRGTNPEFEYSGRWIVRGTRLLKNGKLMCVGRGCHSIYEPRDVIDPANEDRLYVS